MAERFGLLLAIGVLAWPCWASAAPTRGYQGPTAADGADDRVASSVPPPVPAPAAPLETGPREAAPLERAKPRASKPAAVPTVDAALGSSPTVRVVRVDTDALKGSTRAAAFRHAGARTVISMQDAIARGAGSVGEALDRVPGVRSPDGIAGSSGPTKLNVAVRGASPRLGEDATVLLDEVPISMAPYGLPQLSLFPISLFSIDRVDAVRSGASVRFGPTTVGGVFNLVSKPIPLAPEIRVASRVDQWGSFSGGTSFGTTAGKLGVYVEYAPQAGRTYRAHSNYSAHGGLLKLAYTFGPKVELSSTTHGYNENSELPGGLKFSQYDRDPFQSVRPEDGFRGWRIGESLKLRIRPKPNHEIALIGWYNRSNRSNALHHPNAEFGLIETPRDYHVFGVEPRYVVRVKHKRGPFHDLSFGARGVFESAHQRRFDTPDATGVREPYDDDNSRLGAMAFYVEDELYLADEALVLRAGVRGELARMSRRENIEVEHPVLSNSYFQALPSASLRYDPIDELGVFVGYSRSFKAPSFVTIGIVAGDVQALKPVLADSVEAGIKIAELAGLYGEATGWFRNYKNLLDEGEASVDFIGDWRGGGVELDLEWEPGELWEPLTGSSLYGGYSYTASSIYRSQAFNGNKLPWFPAHELWGGLAYAFPWRCSFFGSMPGPDDCRLLKLGADFTYSGAQYSYFDNDPRLTLESGATGGIPAYALVDLYLKFQTLLPRAWTLNLSLGIKNVADTTWFYRTDDLNRGILAQRPRTFFVGLDIGYTFFDAHRRAEARRARRSEAREQR